MLLIIADGKDAHQQHVVSWLDVEFPQQAILISLEEILGGRFAHFVGSETRWNLTTAGGVSLNSEDVTGAVILQPALSADSVNGIVPADRMYVYRESTALLFALLASLECPVINRPWPQSMSGKVRTTELWLAMGVQAGFMPARVTSQDEQVDATTFEAYVIGDHVISASPLDAGGERSARALRTLSGEMMLCLHLRGSGAFPVLCDVTSGVDVAAITRDTAVAMARAMVTA